MESQTAPRTGLHPLVATAAVAVTLACVVGIAAITGILPTGTARQAEPAFVAQSAPATAAVPAAAEAVPAPVVKAVPKPKPVVHKAHVVQEAPVQVAQSRAPAAGSYPPVPPDYRAPVESRVEAPVDMRRTAPVVAARAICYDCGTVESMREVEQKGEGTGLGAVAGGIGGLILGNQVGGGTGKKIATVLGAAGGAYAGHQVEKNARAMKSYETSVRMEDGSYRTIASPSAPTWRTGDPVRVVNGALQADIRQ